MLVKKTRDPKVPTCTKKFSFNNLQPTNLHMLQDELDVIVNKTKTLSKLRSE